MSKSTSRSSSFSDSESVRVGLIHSLSGTMALSERPLLEAELMAIDEINKTGGILGCHIEPVTMDGASAPETFAQKAQELHKDVVEEMYQASVRFTELLETLEVLLDKKTMRRIKLGEQQYRRTQYVVTRGPREIRKALST